jgi:hypothetical protein
MNTIEPDFSVPFVPLRGIRGPGGTRGEKYLDVRERAEAACKSIEYLDIPLEMPTSEDKAAAAALVAGHAGAVTDKEKRAVSLQAAKATPAALRLTKLVLDEFGHEIVQSAVQLRHVVTNKLIQETENPDARIRIRALELLGKISDVGLFSEKTEVTIMHKTTDELRDQLREKLNRLRSGVVVDAVVVDAHEVGAHEVGDDGAVAVAVAVGDTP